MSGVAPSRFRGHGEILDRFRACVSRGRLGNAYLFVGPEGVGKRTLALRLAQGLLCERPQGSVVDPCQICGPCQQVHVNSHPDVLVVSRPSHRAFIPLEMLVGDREHRSETGFCHWVALTPHAGRRKVGIIDDADYLNVEGANSLLKTLEEPPPRSILILIATSEHRQLPTIRSRCQIIRFGPLSPEDVAELLLSEGCCTDRAAAERAARYAEGSLQRARSACHPEWSAFRDNLWQQWSELPASRWSVTESVNDYLNTFGSETADKRRGLRMVLEWSIQFWRAVLLASAQAPHAVDQTLALGVRKALTQAGAADLAEHRLERCLTALPQVDANVMLAGLVEAWVDDIAEGHPVEGTPF